MRPQTQDSTTSNSIEAIMEQLAQALGARIRTQRKMCGLSQDALALACNIDRSYMGRIERGEVNITVVKLYLIANALDCSPSSLLPPMPEQRGY